MERFVELYQMVYQDLYRLAYYYLGNMQDAQDAVQETALRAYGSFGRLKDEGAFRPWIFKILVNCCRSFWRRGREPFFTEPGAQAEGVYEPSLSSAAEMQELLSHLSDEERLIVVLTVFGGYKGEEISRILGKKHSTVRSKYRRALKKLEKEL